MVGARVSQTCASCFGGIFNLNRLESVFGHCKTGAWAWPALKRSLLLCYVRSQQCVHSRLCFRASPASLVHILVVVTALWAKQQPRTTRTVGGNNDAVLQKCELPAFTILLLSNDCTVTSFIDERMAP